jgi:hypothetical protein
MLSDGALSEEGHEHKFWYLMGLSYSLNIFLHPLLPECNSLQPFARLCEFALQISSHSEMALSPDYVAPRTIVQEHVSIHHSNILLHQHQAFIDQCMFTVVLALNSFLPHRIGFAPHR